MIQIGAPAAAIDSPIDHLMACHRRIEQRLDTMFNAAGLLETDRAGALAAIQNSIRFMDTSGERHTEDEEASLFPRLRQKLSSEEIAFLDSLEDQHVEAGRFTRSSSTRPWTSPPNPRPIRSADIANARRGCGRCTGSTFALRMRS